MVEAVVISDVFGTRAGAYTATLLLCRALSNLGIKVTCFSTWIEPGHSVASETFSVVAPLIKRGYRWDWPNRCLAEQVTRYIRKYCPSLIIVMGVTRLSRYLLASSIANRLLIWELTNGCGNKFVDVKATELLPRCKAMLSPSLTIDRNIRKHYQYEGAILRLPFWIEDQKLNFVSRPSEFLADFIYFGRRDEEKGLRELVQATALLTKEHPDMRVVIGGVGDSQSFASIATELKIQKNIVFGSFDSRSDVMQALASSRCLVLPSYHEGYPLVLLEAAQSSLPFIATGVGSVPEVYGGSKACIIVTPRDVKDLAQAMKRILIESDDSYIVRKKAAHEIFRQISSSESVMANLKRILAHQKLPTSQLPQ